MTNMKFFKWVGICKLKHNFFVFKTFSFSVIIFIIYYFPKIFKKSCIFEPKINKTGSRNFDFLYFFFLQTFTELLAEIRSEFHRTFEFVFELWIYNKSNIGRIISVN